MDNFEWNREGGGGGILKRKNTKVSTYFLYFVAGRKASCSIFTFALLVNWLGINVFLCKKMICILKVLLIKCHTCDSGACLLFCLVSESLLLYDSLGVSPVILIMAEESVASLKASDWQHME